MTAANTETEKIVSLSGLKAMTADRMMQSLHGMAQLTHHAECDLEKLLAAKQLLGETLGKLSVEDLLIHVLIRTLEQHPELNGTVVDKQIRLRSSVDLSVAISLPNGALVAPAMFDAGRLSLVERAQKRKDLVERARTNKLSVKEMTGGSFTISNLGLSRVRFFTPIINPPQIAILGIGETRLTPVVTADGSFVAKPLIGLSLTFDHRVINGTPAAEFLSKLCQNIEAVSESWLTA